MQLVNIEEHSVRLNIRMTSGRSFVIDSINDKLLQLSEPVDLEVLNGLESIVLSVCYQNQWHEYNLGFLTPVVEDGMVIAINYQINKDKRLNFKRQLAYSRCA